MTAPGPTLVDAVARAGWSALLPAHRVDGGDQPRGHAACVGTLTLGDGLEVAVVTDDRGRHHAVPLVVAQGGEVRRALPGDGAAEAFVAMLAEGSRAEGGFRVTSWHHRSAGGEQGIPVDQTNESVVVGDAVVVKWMVTAEEGPHPAPALLAELDRAGFGGTPPPWGALEWQPPGEAAPRLLALAVSYLPGAVDGWSWAVEAIRAAAELDEPARAAEAGERTGSLVAAFHVALAGTAQPATAAERAGWRSRARADLERALGVTTGPAHDLLAARAPSIRRIFDTVPSEDAGPVLRVHGDLHVGQVLRVDTGGGASYALTDFDGNPVLPAAERLRRQPAALDVAGMVQSFVHAGLVVRRHHRDLAVPAVDRAGEAASAAFLDAYRSGLGTHADLLDERLLRPFRLQQVCREFIYAATHLPRWSYVPEGALALLLRKDTP